MIFVTPLKTNCSCSWPAVLKEKAISRTSKFKSFARFRLMITEEQYESTDANHCREASASFHERSPTVHAFKEIRGIASELEGLNSLITIILSTRSFPNSYSDFSGQFLWMWPSLPHLKQRISHFGVSWSLFDFAGPVFLWVWFAGPVMLLPVFVGVDGLVFAVESLFLDWLGHEDLLGSCSFSACTLDCKRVTIDVIS